MIMAVLPAMQLQVGHLGPFDRPSLRGSSLVGQLLHDVDRLAGADARAGRCR